MVKSTTSEMVDDFSVPECLQANATWPGDIILRAWHGRTEGSEGRAIDFYCHSGVLCVACPFFSDALSGDWKETRVPAGDDSRPVRKRSRSSRENDRSSTATSDSSHPASHILGTIEMQEENAKVIRDFLCFMYRNLELVLHKDNWLPLIKLGDKVGLPALVSVCTDYAEDEIANMPLEVFQWALTAGKKELFQESSHTLVASLPQYKTHPAYPDTPIHIRLMLEENRAYWLEQCLGISDEFQCEFDQYNVPFPSSDRGVLKALKNVMQEPTETTVRVLLNTTSIASYQDSSLGHLVMRLQELLCIGIMWDDLSEAGVSAPVHDA